MQHYSYSIATTHILSVDTEPITHHSHFHIGIPFEGNLRFVYHDSHPITFCKGLTNMSVMSLISLETLAYIFPIEIIDNWSDAEAQILSKKFCPQTKEQFDHREEIRQDIKSEFEARQIVFRERDRLVKEQEERHRICEIRCREIEGIFIKFLLALIFFAYFFLSPYIFFYRFIFKFFLIVYFH